MRYYVYKNSRILGPYAPEDLGEAGGIRPETLLCEEGVSGRRDLDWKCASDIPGLAGLYIPEGAALSLIEGPFSSARSGILERLEMESLDISSQEPGGWIEELFEDADLKRNFADLFVTTEEDFSELKTAREKVRDLTEQLEALQSRVGELEGEKRKILRQLGERQREISAEPAEAPVVPESPALPAPPKFEETTPAFAPEVPAAPGVKAIPEDAEDGLPNAAAPGVKAIPEDAEDGLPSPAVPEPPAAPEAPPAQGAEPGRKGIKFNLPKRFAAPPPALSKKEIKLGPTRTFRVVQREAPAEEPAPGVKAIPEDAEDGALRGTAPGVKAIPEDAEDGLPNLAAPAGAPPAGPVVYRESPALPEAGTALPLGEGPSMEAPSGPAAPPTAELESLPLPALQLTPEPAQAPPPSLEPPPISPVFEAPPASDAPSAPPMTMTFSGPPVGPGPAPSAALTPSRANAEAAVEPEGESSRTALGTALPAGAAAPVLETQELIARLAKPAAPPTTAEKPKRGPSRAFIAASVVLLLGLAIVGSLFLRDSKGLKLMVNMGADQKPLGTEAEEEPQVPPAAPGPSQPTQAPPGTSALTAETPGPAGGALPEAQAAKRDFVPDASREALDLVKNYPLDGGRGSVGQWLQYSFTANPGEGNQEEWSAGGGVDATTYIVEYRVRPGPKSSVREPITYLFEADISRKTVKGSNPAARELLAGGAPVKPKRPKAALVKRRRPARLRAAGPKQVPLLPLPSDADLLPPAEDDAGFNSDTVRRGL